MHERRTDPHVQGMSIAGAFGVDGLLTAIGLAISPVLITFTVAVVFTAIVATLAVVVMAMVAFGIYELVQWILEFHNTDEKKWPQYDNGKTKNNGQVVEAAWSIRVFEDGGCGNHPVHGDNPYFQLHNNWPSMITEYISNDLSYSDHKPCESFMISADYHVSSVAVWIAKSVTDKNPGFIFLYSHPLCHVTMDPSRVTADSPNGTFPSTPSKQYPDYMQIYNGSAPRYGSGKAYEEGTWQCYKGRFAAFTVLFPNITNINTEDGYEITPQNTVPNPNKKGASDRAARLANMPVMVTDINKTYLKGTKPSDGLF